MRGIIGFFLIFSLCLLSCFVRETAPIIKVIPNKETEREEIDTVDIEVVSTVPKMEIKLTETSEVKKEESYRFTVQIGSYSNYENASKCKLEAQQRLSEEVFVEIENSYYKVRAGKYAERVNAEKARDRIRNIYLDAFIVEKK